MGNQFAHGTWIVIKNNTPNIATTSVSNFRFEQWGDWADRPDHKCNKRMIKPNQSMEEFLRMARGVKSNKWTLTLTFSDDTKLVLRIDQRYVNMKVKHWQWVEGLNLPPFIEAGDKDLYKIHYKIDWEKWVISIEVSNKTEEEKEKERDDEKILKAKEEAKKMGLYVNYFPEAEAVVSGKGKNSAEENIKIKSQERAERKAREKAQRKVKEDEKRESRTRANKRVKEMERNWRDIKDLAYFLRSYPLVNYFAFLLFMYLFYFIMLFYFALVFNTQNNSVVALNTRHA